MLKLSEIEARCQDVTEGPWCWESVAEKSNEFVVGLAIDKNDNPICGEIPKDYDEDKDYFMDEEIIRKSEIGANESGSCNFRDADFIAHSRTDLPECVEALTTAIHLARCLSAIARQYGNESLAQEAEDFLAKVQP